MAKTDKITEVEFRISSRLAVEFNSKKRQWERDSWADECNAFVIEGIIDDPDEKKVFRADGYILPVRNFFGIADSISQDMYEVAARICDSDGRVRMKYRFCEGCRYVVVIDDLKTDPEYRGRGIAAAFLSQVQEITERVEPDVCGVYLMASPYELLREDREDEYLDMRERLIKYFERFEFARTAKKSFIMALKPAVIRAEKRFNEDCFEDDVDTGLMRKAVDAMARLCDCPFIMEEEDAQEILKFCESVEKRWEDEEEYDGEDNEDNE